MGYTINSSENKYNGWTNYATWRVNLEVFDGLSLRDHFEELPELGEVASWAESYAEELLDAAMSAPVGIRKRMLTPCDIVSGWASAFLADVNWHEIAEHLIDYTNDCAKVDAA